MLPFLRCCDTQKVYYYILYLYWRRQKMGQSGQYTTKYWPTPFSPTFWLLDFKRICGSEDEGRSLFEVVFKEMGFETWQYNLRNLLKMKFSCESAIHLIKNLLDKFLLATCFRCLFLRLLNLFVAYLQKISRSVGLEPTLPEGIWFLVRRLNHSARLSFLEISNYCMRLL